MLVKVVLLATWVATLDLWIARHFHSGLGVDEVLILIGVPLGSAWFTGVFDFFVDPEAQKSFKGYTRGLIQRQFNYRVIGLLYVAFFVFAMTYSSIRITPLASSGTRTITLSKVGAIEPVKSVETSFEKVVDLRLFINPFATEYEVAVSGFLPKVVAIQPLIGTTLIPDQDLQRISTILFRPSVKSYTLLRNRGWIEVYQLSGDQFVKIAKDQGNHAWFIGPRRTQATELRNEWRLEATAQGLNERTQAGLILRWRNPKKLEVEADIGPGAVVCALVTNIDRKITLAGAVATVGSSNYVDIPLGDIDNEMAITSSDGDALCKWLYNGTG